MRSVLFSLLMLSSTAQAADWLAIQGTEPDDPDKSRLRAAGFVQISAEAFLARPVEGLTGDLEPYNGQIAAFNKVPGADGTAKITLRRVRAGFRGVIPDTKPERRLRLYLLSQSFDQFKFTKHGMITVQDVVEGKSPQT